jgi:hypothetical protein
VVLASQLNRGSIPTDIGDIPKQDLKTFILSKQNDASEELSSIESLKTETFESYASTYCLEGVTLEKTREALRVDLNGIPEPVRDDIVSRALIEGISSRNTWMNSKADLVNRAHAHSYMAFYSTSYHPGNDGKDMYGTCVMVAGVEFTLAQIVVDHQIIIEEEYQAGTKLECHGWFLPSCHQVPYYAKRTSKIPVFNRAMLSLKQQKELNDWMSAEACSSAQHLVGGGLSPSQEVLADSDSASNKPARESAWDWKPPCLSKAASSEWRQWIPKNLQHYDLCHYFNTIL